MRKFGIAIIFMAMFVISGCGGGSDSSFSSTFTKNDVTYLCKSQAAFDQCKEGDCGRCSCQENCPDENAPVITENCSVNDEDGSFIVTNAGCIYGSSPKTAVCVNSGSAIKMLSGTGHTAAQVISGGSQFSNGISINGETANCE